MCVLSGTESAELILFNWLYITFNIRINALRSYVIIIKIHKIPFSYYLESNTNSINLLQSSK